MSNVLQQLLDAENQAQKIVEDARKQRDHLVQEAKQEVKRAEERFESRIPDIYYSFQKKSEEKAQTHINELERRYQERYQEIIDLTEQKQPIAIEKVLQLILNPRSN